jgi:hypothetical protein
MGRHHAANILVSANQLRAVRTIVERQRRDSHVDGLASAIIPIPVLHTMTRSSSEYCVNKRTKCLQNTLLEPYRRFWESKFANLDNYLTQLQETKKPHSKGKADGRRKR